ncbi:hypothetical protein [Rhizobium bangladeshense]|uniref:hypothetical protein n=1 Tax=Rhizobium bangladeshense TaxID=1138189 RepID=UPI0007E55516|nr:hypothetical protein [Rhizobium bangladeshense]
MRISEIQGPSLTEVIAFTMIEKPEDVAIVECTAANRMATVRGWYGWQVADVEVVDDADELVRLTICAQPVGAGYREEATLTFLTDRVASVDQRALTHSSRLAAYRSA